MNSASKSCLVLFGVAALLASAQARAEQGLNASSQTKVNSAKAKAWTNSDANKKDPALEKRVVNIGNKRSGDCNLNIGTAQSGGKAPKEIVVTTKEVINICK